VVGIARMVQLGAGGAEQLAGEGTSVEVIDPRTVLPLDIDHDRAIGRQDPAGC